MAKKRALDKLQNEILQTIGEATGSRLPIERGLDSTFYTHGYGKLVGSHPGIIGETVLKGLKDTLSTFITDYMESNAAYEATFADKRLRGVDRAIKGHSFRLRQTDRNLEGIDLWRKRYEEVLKAR